MTNIPQTTPPDSLIPTAGRFAYASGVVSTIGIVFFVAMLVVKGPFGRLNDICVLIQYLLALLIPLALHQLLKARAPFLSQLAMLIGIVAMVALDVLQYLLIVGSLSYYAQDGSVTI